MPRAGSSRSAPIVAAGDPDTLGLRRRGKESLVASQDVIGRARSLLTSIPSVGKLLLRLARDPRVPRRSKLLFGGVAVYLLIPFDIVPDWIPGLGQVGDLVLLALALDAMLNRVPEEIIADHWEGDPEALRTLRRMLGAATRFVPSHIKGWLG